MPRPPITRLEIAAVLRAEVYRLMARGMDRATAIKAVAEQHGLDPEWVAELVDAVDGLARGEA
jgi:hypothetical protein